MNELLAIYGMRVITDYILVSEASCIVSNATTAKLCIQCFEVLVTHAHALEGTHWKSAIFLPKILQIYEFEY